MSGKIASYLTSAVANKLKGLFFAAIEIKILLAHILQKYDLKLEAGTKRPVNSLEEVWFVTDTKARALLKSRKNK